MYQGMRHLLRHKNPVSVAGYPRHPFEDAPLKQSRNLAARAGHWSARHRKIAIFGWIAFVVIAFVIGGAAGTKKIKDENQGNGDSRRAAQIVAAAGLKDRASEQVLIQSRGAVRAKDPQFRAAVLDVTNRLKQ